MEDKVFRFYFKKNNTQYYRVNSINNNVSLSTTKSHVESCVEGWEDMKFGFDRNMKYWGLFRQYALDLRFVNDGARIARHVYYHEGFEGKLILYVEKLNTATQQYEFWNQSDFDLTTANDQNDYFDCELKQGGIQSLFESRKDSVHQIKLTKQNSLNVNLPGLTLNYDYKWLSSMMLDSTTNHHKGGHRYTLMEMVDASMNDYDYFEYMFLRKDQSMINEFADNKDINNNCFLQSFTDEDFQTTIHINGLFKWLIHAGMQQGSTRVRFFIVKTIPNNPPNTLYYQTIYTSPYEIAGVTHEIPLNIIVPNFNIEARCKYHLAFDIEWSVASSDVPMAVDIKEMSINVYGKAKLPTSRHYAKRYIDVLKEVFAQVTDGTGTIQSNFLSNPNSSDISERKKNWDNSPYNTILTSGESLKQIDNNNPKIRVSLEDMLKDCWARWGLALYMVNETTFGLEPLEFIFRNSNISSLPVVNNFKISQFQQNVFNKIKVGQRSFEYGQLNGMKEQSIEQEYLLTGVTRYDQTDDIVSPFRFDIHGIEWARRELFYATADVDGSMYVNSKDSVNDTFVIEIDPVPRRKGLDVHNQNPYYVPYKNPVISTQSLDVDNIYNVALSPKRMLFRHLNRIRSLIEVGKIKFQTATRNINMVSNLFSGIVAEQSNVSFSGQSEILLNINTKDIVYISQAIKGASIFQPIVFEFDCSPSYNMMENIGFNTNGYMTFTFRGHSWKGYILEMGVVPGSKDTYRFKLLSHKDNDLTKLIK